MTDEPNDADGSEDRSRAEKLQEAKRATDELRRSVEDWNSIDEIRYWRETRRSSDTTDDRTD